jgi:hypothetical protein
VSQRKEAITTSLRYDDKLLEIIIASNDDTQEKIKEHLHKVWGILRDLSKHVKNNRADLSQRFGVQVLKFTFERIQEKVLRPKKTPQFDESIPIEKELKEAVDSLKKGLQKDGVDRKPFTKEGHFISSNVTRGVASNRTRLVRLL